jgi:signal transduction histidine kinase/DNA-binding response OmpR family regulator
MNDRESVLRFDLAMQKSHLLVYTVAFITSLIGRALGVFTLNLTVALVGWAGACACAIAMYLLFLRGVDRKWLTPIWIAVDIAFVTVGVAATGGISSPWFIWYLAAASGTAFALGKRAAYVVGALNTIAYLALLAFLDEGPLLIAVTRMLFLFGASSFFINGIANLQRKRLEVRKLAADLAIANEGIQQADRMKSQFLANMSHELRTPMNSIIGFSEILIERLEGKIDPKQVTFLQHIHASGQHLLNIINDILDLSKIEAGKMEIYTESFEVRPVIESVCSVMRGMTRDRVPQFLVEVPPNLPLIETDLAKFKQVLYNLLSNAVKFSPADRPIAITAMNAPAGKLSISVSDQGIGIDPQHHQVIFEEFRQVDASVRRTFGGTGLGLALVKRFIELQGGTVRVDSAPGRGSTFTFSLPLQSQAAVVSRDALPAALPQRADSVLVIEDDDHAYDLIASALSSAGYLPIRARHGEEAIKLARASKPLAVTLDVVLPGIDGWEVLKHLKSDDATRDVPVVIISIVDNRDLGLALGADDYFVKPVDRSRLLERVWELTSARGTKPRVLMIDDDASIHAVLGDELTRLGYTVESAFSGDDGVDAANESSPDVIILDLMMPGMSGFDVAGALKDNPATANIPILVLTSKDISDDERRMLHTKVSTFVHKGVSAREHLVREIRRLGARRATATSS